MAANAMAGFAYEPEGVAAMAAVSLATAVALNEHKAPNGGIDLHGKHPWPPPKGPA